MLGLLTTATVARVCVVVFVACHAMAYVTAAAVVLANLANTGNMMTGKIANTLHTKMKNVLN